MDDIKVRCFMKLAQTLNFTRAAEQLFLTQQAVSRSISALEKELELKLFLRSTRSVRLTQEGAQLYDFLAYAENEYQQLISQLRKQQHAQTVNVGCQNYLSFNSVLRQAAAKMKLENPDITLGLDRYSPPILRQLLADGDLDMVIIYDRFFPDRDGCCTLELQRIKQFMMVSFEYPLPEEDTVAALRAMPFIIDKVDRESQRDFDRRVSTERERWGFTGDTIIAPDRDSAYTYAEMGRGVLVGTDISIMSTGRALKRFDVGSDEPLIAVWSQNSSSSVILQYTQILRDAFSKKK